LEFVDKRDRVDRFPARVKVTCDAVDGGVALPVEVRGVEDVRNRVDRVRRQHHRPQDRLLGLDVLRRDRGGAGQVGGPRHPAYLVTAPSTVKGTEGAARPHAKVFVCAGTREHTFVSYPQRRLSSPTGKRRSCMDELPARSGKFVGLSTRLWRRLWMLWAT